MAMDVWLGSITALLQLDDSKRYLCSIPNTKGRLLLGGKGAEAQTGPGDFVLRSRQSLRYFLSLPVRSVHIFKSLRGRIFT